VSDSLTSAIAIVVVVCMLTVPIWWIGRTSEREEAQRREERLAAYTKAKQQYDHELALVDAPPPSPFQLLDGERVVFTGSASRTFDAGYTAQPTTSVTKTSGRAVATIVGGVLLGPIGAVAGAASSRESVTHQGPTVTQGITVTDSGTLTITTTRVLFIGEKQVLEIPRASILQTHISFSPSLPADDGLSMQATRGRSEIRFRRADEPASEMFLTYEPVFLAAALRREGIDIEIPPPPISPERPALT
jgi:hypothetical protein